MDWAGRKPAPGKTGPFGKETLREKVRELSTISGDMEMLTKQLVRPHNMMQVSVLRDRMDQLTKMQRRLIEELVGQCPQEELATRFADLDRRLEAVRSRVQDSRDADELETFRQQIDPLVEEWAQVFQELVVVTVQAAPA